MDPLEIYQWLAFAGVNVAGVVLSWALGYLFMRVCLKPERIARAAGKRVGSPLLYNQSKSHLGTGLQPWVGAIEILLYSASIALQHPEFIAVWLGTKYLAAYKTWGEDPIGRTFYNRSLFGSGLNILIGTTTGVVAIFAFHNPQKVRLALLQVFRIAARGATMLQLVAGAIIAILITIIVEELRRPHLTLSIEDPPHDANYPSAPAKNMRTLRVKLFNKPLGWMVRAPALQCQATITFKQSNGQKVFDRTMRGRWSSSPEPVPLPIVNLDRVMQFHLLDFGRLTTESRIDVYPGESELLDIAVRLDDEEACYGWNNETYFCSTPWRNPDWKLERGSYIVEIDITSSGQKCDGVFLLINEGVRTDFQLKPAH